MRHRLFGKQLSRNTAHRKALRRNMAASLIQHGTIRTTDVKAKQLRSFVEKLITTARRDTLAARRQVVAMLQDREMVDDEGELDDLTVVQKLFREIAPRYANRPGGYTRIIRLSERRIGDAGKQVLLQLVEESASRSSEGGATESRRRKRATKRIRAAAGLRSAASAPAAAPAAEPTSEPAAGEPPPQS